MSAIELLTSGLSDGAGSAKGTVGGIAAGVTAIGLGLKSFTTIPEGHIGIKTRFGKVRRYRTGEQKGHPIMKQPGAHPTFPGVHAYRTINTRLRSNDLEPAHVQIRNEDGSSEKRALRASVNWRVSDEGDNPYRALFEVDDGSDLTQIVTNFCLGGLRSVLEAEGMPESEERLLEATRLKCATWLPQIGVELLGISLKDTTRSEAQILAESLRGPEAPNPHTAAERTAVTLGAEEVYPLLHLVQEEDPGQA